MLKPLPERSSRPEGRPEGGGGQTGALQPRGGALPPAGCPQGHQPWLWVGQEAGRGWANLAGAATALLVEATCRSFA